MNVSLRWLREFVDIPEEDPEHIAEVFASLGHEVEGYEIREAPFSGVVVGRVEKIDSHPRADRLRFCKVDVGGRVEDIVCGAHNFEEGAVVAVSLPGAVLAGGLEVGVRTIRGIESHGMICSESELGLGDDREGILVLGPDEVIGTDFSQSLPYPDVIFDLSITPNRGDAMSILGLARDLAAYYDVPVRMPTVELEEAGEPSDARIVLEDPEGCPRYVAREVRGVAAVRSPLWMRLRLRDAGVRAISAIVDITNYVLLELGQPLHAFDLDTIPSETIIVRKGRRGEHLRTLDGENHDITPEDLLITDPDRVIAFAGVMGGEETEVGSETARVLIEAAHFDAPTVMHTARRHGLRTEASIRFERGVDPHLPSLAAERAAALIATLAGGTPAPGAKDAYPKPIQPWQVNLPAGEPARLLGVPVGVQETSNLLNRLGFEVSGADPLIVTVPTYRPDVTRPADLVEEVGRLYGLNRIPGRLPHGPGTGLEERDRRLRTLRSVLVGAGLSEASTWTFMAPSDLSALHRDPADAIRLRNPVSEEQSMLRNTLLPGLLNAVRFNTSRGMPSVALFETGRVFLDEPDPVDPHIPHQPETLGFVLAGEFGPAILGVRRHEVDFSTAQAVSMMIVQAMDLDVEIESAEVPGFHPTRCAVVKTGEIDLGVFGELHPAVARSFDLDGRVAAGEFRLGTIVGPHEYWEFREPSNYPPIVFDLAFDVADEVNASELLGTVRRAAGSDLERVELFDLFKGRILGPGRKSLAMQLTFRSPTSTLTNEDVRVDRGRIIASVAEELGGRLRGGT
ncbi:MAG: phenylalanine--tRNA ligase subunit beta [Acidimicrobiia bacterium]